MTQASKDAADKPLLIHFSILLHLESGSIHTFPEMEFFCWLRSDGKTWRMLTVRPDRRPNLVATAKGKTEYLADEREVPAKDIEVMANWVAQLSSWPPQIRADRGEPDNSWWIRVMCRLEWRGQSAIIDIGGVGLDGVDAGVFRKLSERIFDLAGVGDSWARNVLVGKSAEA